MADAIPTIRWGGDWEPFDEPGREGHVLAELRRELASNPDHPLHGKAVRVLGMRDYDDFILHLPEENCYAYVHLTWSRETDPRWPTCELLDGVDAVNAFIRE